MSMNILVLGGSQGTGALAVKDALARGHRVTAFARTPQRLGVEHPNLRLVVGDFHDAASVRAAVPGHDAVIITVSPPKLKTFKEKPEYFSSGTRHVIAAMKELGVRRLVVLSALGTGESRRLLPAPLRLLMLDWLLKLPYADHETQEQLVRDSGLDWVIARPGGLTNGPARGRFVAKKEIARVPSSISRADLAHFLVDACEKPDWLGAAVHLGG